MNSRELAQALRAMADRVEAAGLPEDMRWSVKLITYGVDEIETLKAARRLMDSPEPHSSSDGYHWISSDNDDGVGVTAHYKAGLLGKTKRETVKVVEVEDAADLSLLEQQ